MLIDIVFQLVNFISNKEQRGNISPSQFNVLARAVQLEYISKRIGNIKIINERGVPAFGYESTWRIHEDLRPLIFGPISIPVQPSGAFAYPYGYVWPDAVSTNDYRPIRRLTEDQYPFVKSSDIVPPTAKYPVMIMRGQYGFIDPYSIGSFMMSYLKLPPDPVWGYTPINEVPVFDAGLSTDFSVTALSINELAMLILQHLGINLGSEEISQYANTKEITGV